MAVELITRMVAAFVVFLCEARSAVVACLCLFRYFPKPGWQGNGRMIATCCPCAREERDRNEIGHDEFLQNLSRASTGSGTYGGGPDAMRVRREGSTRSAARNMREACQSCSDDGYNLISPDEALRILEVIEQQYNNDKQHRGPRTNKTFRARKLRLATSRAHDKRPSK